MTLLGDIAVERKENQKGDKIGIPIVGLEHITPGEVTLQNWSNDSENTFTKIFKKGDILFGRRRAYLKKAAVAPFDGICSGDITVITAKEDKIIPELLPFIIQDEMLFDFAVEKSAGSLSPRVKWENLKNYEFKLPSLEKQQKLAKVLWAAENTKQVYKKMLIQLDKLIEAKFIEITEAKKTDNKAIISLILEPIVGEWGQEDLDGTGVKVLRTTNFTDYGAINYNEIVTRKIKIEKFKEKSLKFADIIIEKSGGSDTKPVGRVVLYEKGENQYLFNNFTSALRVKDNSVINPIYLFEFLHLNYLNGGTKKYDHKTTGIHNLRLDDYLKETNIPLVDIHTQNCFSNFVIDVNQTKLKLKQEINKLNLMTKAIINENLK